ncbi:hypothetical protein CMQ_3697 [Grosmannia clavigera kw1407]|uniref:Uncharacterized protein n=1 Tax=Grosmannia clavigera (strain kw1407 / UAMH 11150) TaxID=655863 RepID=F0X9K8_GROCL|nr:uncharacterized protein CMQ_3697 [Grosmannia clavigera kw1407]EFX05628.1 hypothetical protein CMQ_3697 [Grosmannia clavigera kw1407]
MADVSGITAPAEPASASPSKGLAKDQVSPPKEYASAIETGIADNGDNDSKPGAAGSESDNEGFGSDRVSTAGTNLSSSVRDYAFENSRRYHNFQEGRYNFPNDEPEQEREDMKHAMSMIYDGLQGISLRPFTRELKWTTQEVEAFLVNVMQALMDDNQQTHLLFHVEIGQRPF